MLTYHLGFDNYGNTEGTVLDDIKKGDIIKIPNDYSQKMILYIDKKTFFPVLIKVYDEVGLFEQYDYSNIVFNPVFASDDFLKSNKNYNFK